MHPKHEGLSSLCAEQFSKLILSTDELSEQFKRQTESAVELVASILPMAADMIWETIKTLSDNRRVVYLAEHRRTERVRKKNKARAAREIEKMAREVGKK